MNVQFFAIPRSRAILWALKIHRTLVQIATTIIFRCGDQQRKGIYKSEKKLQVSCTLIMEETKRNSTEHAQSYVGSTYL